MLMFGSILIGIITAAIGYPVYDFSKNLFRVDSLVLLICLLIAWNRIYSWAIKINP